MLEKVGESGFTGFNLVSRARLYDDIKRYNVRIIRRYSDYTQAVREIVDLIVEGKNVGLLNANLTYSISKKMTQTIIVDDCGNLRSNSKDRSVQRKSPRAVGKHQ